MKVFVVAGEASGDKLGAALMEGLRQRLDSVRFDGIGGEEMRRAGLESRFPMSDLSVMGLAEVLARYRLLRRRLDETVEAVLKAKPDLLVTIDSPDFCLRVARAVRARRELRVVHYVSPSIWAWRPGRARKLVGVVDQVLTLLPFEPPPLEALGLRADFVGHPIVCDPVASAAQIAQFRTRFSFSGPLLCLLPGSRASEIRRLGPVFGRAAALLAQKIPDLQTILPVAPGLEGQVNELVGQWPIVPKLFHSGEVPREILFGAADAALAASGTVSLELAAARTPMVIAYDMHWLSRQIISRMLLVDTVTLVNLVSETRAVPEFIGARCRSELIAPRLEAIFEAPAEQIPAMRMTMERLGAGGEAPGLRAADAILAALD